MTQEQDKPATEPIDELGPPPPPADTQVLQKLSSPPFPRSGFPLLGTMVSVYEHVRQVISRTPER